LGATVTLISGKFYPEIPLPYLFAAASLVFAAISLGFAAIWVGLLRFDELRTRRTPANKLTSSAPRVIFDYVRDATGKITGIEYAQINMELYNLATFDISYVVDEVSWSLDGRVNQDANPILKGVLPPSHLQVYRQPRIDMHGVLPKPRLEAKQKLEGDMGGHATKNIPPKGMPSLPACLMKIRDMKFKSRRMSPNDSFRVFSIP
jgi:hypothetical protein